MTTDLLALAKECGASFGEGRRMGEKSDRTCLSMWDDQLAAYTARILGDMQADRDCWRDQCSARVEDAVRLGDERNAARAEIDSLRAEIAALHGVVKAAWQFLDVIKPNAAVTESLFQAVKDYP